MHWRIITTGGLSTSGQWTAKGPVHKFFPEEMNVIPDDLKGHSAISCLSLNVLYIFIGPHLSTNVRWDWVSPHCDMEKHLLKMNELRTWDAAAPTWAQHQSRVHSSRIFIYESRCISGYFQLLNLQKVTCIVVLTFSEEIHAAIN